MEWAFQMKRNYTVSYYTEFTCKLNPQSTIKIWALYNGFLQSYRPIVPVQSTVNLSHAHPLAFFLFLFQLNHPPLPLDIFPFLSFSFFLFFSFHFFLFSVFLHCTFLIIQFFSLCLASPLLFASCTVFLSFLILPMASLWSLLFFLHGTDTRWSHTHTSKVIHKNTCNPKTQRQSATRR